MADAARGLSAWKVVKTGERMSDTKLYSFDPAHPITVSLSYTINETPHTLTHELRRATLAELLERDAQSVTELEEIAPGEDVFHTEAVAANARLWDKIAQRVQGYKVGAATKDQWIEVTPELAAKIPSAHKHAAITGLYAANCTVEMDADEGFSLDGDTYRIKQTIGASDAPEFVILHTLKQPTESERREYDANAGKASQVMGSRKRKLRFRTNLKADVALYDKLFVSVSGCEPATVDAIDPILKRQAVQSLLAALNASLSD
jgi:hypothetical protein